MLYALFSDIHGNLHALREVLADIKARKPDRVVCLGDMVGYGAHPNDVVEACRETADVIVAGNHDHAAVGLLDMAAFNSYAYQAANWTRDQLTPENTAFLRQLPFSAREDKLLFCHASPSQPQQWFYVFSDQDASLSMSDSTAATAFIGHTHVPRDHRTRHGRLINVGSVGQPRDGDPRAAYTLYEETTGHLELVRLPYAVEKAQQAILDVGLPTFLGERLRVGR